MSQPVLSRPTAAAPLPRSLAAVDDDLRSCHRIRSDAARELAGVRRRQEELADLEATLVVTIDCRSRMVDHLLDERLRTAAAARVPAGHLPPAAVRARCR
ncbi:hypothetical protein [Blastococcus sp. SYSU DS0533]